jgi:hypothetical protein
VFEETEISGCKNRDPPQMGPKKPNYFLANCLKGFYLIPVIYEIICININCISGISRKK